MTFYQIFLPIATLAYLLLVFVLRSVILWKQTGVNPFVFGRTEKAHDYIGITYKMIVGSMWISIGVFSFFQDQYEYLLPIWYLETEELRIIGLVLMALSFLWTSLAQNQMSHSWRIGINFEERTDLVNSGLFGYSRNPVFLGVLVSYLSTFLIIPNALSFATCIVLFVVIQIQVRMEEEYLLSVHGDRFLIYKKNVRRWF